jgi:RNA polymerase sigma-70 factor, ECF subfamily
MTKMVTMTNDPKHTEFLKIFMSNRHEIQSFIVGMVRNSSAAEDIFQEVSIILWNKFDSYNADSSFKAWARGIASNKVLQFWQKQKKTAAVYSPEFMDSVLAAYERTDTAKGNMIAALQKCREQLPEKQAVLLKYKYDEKYKLERIAEVTGKSLAATQKTISRLRFVLQTCIKNQMSQEDAR